MAEEQYGAFMNFPTDVKSYQFQNKFGFFPSELPKGEMSFEKTQTPSRDAMRLFGMNLGMSPKEADKMFGGQGTGTFLDLGLMDVPFVGGAVDAIDAYNRLQETKQTDEFSDVFDVNMQFLPFAMKVAAVLSPNDNVIKDYYDGKKADIATIIGGPLGFLGFGTATGKFLRGLSNKTEDVPIMGNTINKMLPNIQGEPIPQVPFNELAAAKAADPDAAIKGDKFTNLFEKAQKAFRDEIYDE